jgi:regulation of enolase protein 1 (concanavalin A-like superfamily)
MNWIKLAFENSDATGPGIVTVVTNGTSDDANGAILNREKKIWLAMIRKDNIYSMHWSKDGKNYNMTRLTKMLETDVVSIGIEAQSPVGKVATHKVYYFGIEQRTVENLRKLK